jgi:Protein of unknown function (DUF2934)
MRKKAATAANPAPAQPPPEVRAAVPGDANPAGAVPEEEVRLRAYQKWEAAGKPAGDGVNFWLAAERELREPR